MKHIVLTLLVAAMLIPLSASMSTARSMQFGGSFLQRSDGVNALYWNPANIPSSALRTGDMVFLNLGYYLQNNFMTLEEYNNTMGETLTTEDEDDLLNGAPSVLRMNTEAHSQLLGWSQKRMAICLSLHLYGAGAFQREYMELLFRGNEYDRTYTFDNGNSFEAFSYVDVTYGVGGYSVNDWLPGLSWLPPTQFGFAASVLVGIVSAESRHFEGHLETGENGLDLHQTVDVKLGVGGYGFKGVVGLSSQVNENLSVGLAFDNILGLISWQGKSQERRFTVNADSVQLADMDDDIIRDEQTKLNEDGFVTTLPFAYNLGALYTWRNVNFSLDWQQRVNESPLGNAKPTLSMATEYSPLRWLPLRMAWSGNRDRTGLFTLGVGLRVPGFEMDLAATPDDGLFPSYSDMRVGWALNWRLTY